MQLMKILLRTSFRISTNFYSGDDGRPFQGAVQGSRAAPALWMIISILLVRYSYSKNLTTQLATPFFEVIMMLAALFFADDTDLCAFNSGSDAAEGLVVKGQRLLDVWCNTLKFTGGGLKLSKCY